MEEFKEYLNCVFDMHSYVYVEFTHRLCCRYNELFNVLYVPYAIKLDVLRWLQGGGCFSRWENGRLVLSYVE